jgi:hypothetical protein
VISGQWSVIRKTRQYVKSRQFGGIFSIKLISGKFLKILKKLFKKSFLSRRPQTAKLSPCASEWRRQFDAQHQICRRIPEGVNSPLAGVFCSFTFPICILLFTNLKNCGIIKMPNKTE